jgi:hypothetical protein
VAAGVGQAELQQLRMRHHLVIEQSQAVRDAVEAGVGVGRVDDRPVAGDGVERLKPAYGGQRQAGLVAEAPEHGHLVHAGPAGDLAGGDRGHAALGCQGHERAQDPLVGGKVGHGLSH